MNIYACYRNGEGKWVVDGKNGRATYNGRFDRNVVMATYKGEFRSYECGRFNITVFERDIKYSKGYASLVTIDKFDENDEPIGKSKHFYLRDGQELSLDLTESDIEKIYNGKEGSWID